MKRIKLLVALTLAFIFSLLTGAHAQIELRSSTMSLGEKPAFVIDFENADKKLAEKKWKEHLKEYGKVNKNKKAKEWYTMQTTIPNLGGTKLVNIYFQLEQGKNMTRAFVFVDDGTKFIGNGDDEEDGVRAFVNGYANRVNKEVAKKAMEKGEDELKDFNKKLSKLEDKNEDYHKEIEKCQKKIIEAEEDIENNLKEQDEAKENIEMQKSKVEALIEAYNSIGRG